MSLGFPVCATQRSVASGGVRRGRHGFAPRRCQSENGSQTDIGVRSSELRAGNRNLGDSIRGSG